MTVKELADRIEEHNARAEAARRMSDRVLMQAAADAVRACFRAATLRGVRDALDAELAKRGH